MLRKSNNNNEKRKSVGEILDHSPEISDDDSSAEENKAEVEEATNMLKKAYENANKTNLMIAMSMLTKFIEDVDKISNGEKVEDEIYFSKPDEKIVLTVKSREFDSVCEDKLKNLSLPSKVLTVHSKQPIPVPMLYIGATFFRSHQNKKTEHSIELDRACDNGDYYALKTRSENNKNIVLNPQSTETARKNALAQIQVDLDTISEFYWTVGHVHACRIYHIIGNYYNNAKQGTEKQAFYEASVEHMYWAECLKKTPESLYMIEKLYKEKSMKDSTGWATIDEMKEEVTRHLSSDPVLRDERAKFIHNKVYDEVKKLYELQRGTTKRR